MVRRVLFNARTRKLVSVLPWLVLSGASLFAQGNSDNAPGQGGGLPSFAIGNRVPLPVDWSFSHVIYTRGFSNQHAANMQNDPRLYNSWLLQGHVQNQSSTNNGQGNPKHQPPPTEAPPIDWSFPLGTAATASIAQNMFPAKFNFDVNAPISGPANQNNCLNDFVVYGLNVAGSNPSGGGVAGFARTTATFNSGSTSGATITINGVVLTAGASNTPTTYATSGSTSVWRTVIRGLREP